MQDSEIFFLTNGGKILSGVDERNCPAELRVPFGVTKIERRALADCPAKQIFLPDTVTHIGYEAFSGCDALEYVRFPKKVESVEPSVFRGCFSLQKVELGDEILELSENMFECCYSLEEAPFRSGIVELPRNVFSECVSLKSLVIPEGVVVIKSGAAAYCQNLSTLVLPSSVKVIEDDAFRSCVSLAHIRFSAENPVFFIDEDSGALFEKHEDGTLSLIKVPVNAKRVRIPKNVTHSHSEAFQGCDSIETVFIDCALVDHPLFVALKTEIVDAQFIDETQIRPEEKSEPEQKKPRTPRTKKNEGSTEKLSEAKTEEKVKKNAKAKSEAEKSTASETPKSQKTKRKTQAKNESANSSDEENPRDEKKDAGKKRSARVKQSAKSVEGEENVAHDEPAEKKSGKKEAQSESAGAKKKRTAKKDSARLEIVEPETPEPSEPNIDGLFADAVKIPRTKKSAKHVSTEAAQTPSDELDVSHVRAEKNPSENFPVEKNKAEVSAKGQGEVSDAAHNEEPSEIEIVSNEAAANEIEADEIEITPTEIEEPIVELSPEPEIEESASEENELEEIEPIEIASNKNAVDEIENEPQVEESAVEKNTLEEVVSSEIESSEIVPNEIKEPIVEAASKPEIEESALEENVIEENAPSDIENEQHENALSADDMLADILGQNIVSNETDEDEEGGIKGVTITAEELDEAMMRGIQEEDERGYDVPEGFFPSTNSESEEAQECAPPPEPRFINGMIGVSSAYEIVEERTLYPERADEDLCQTPPNEMEDITTLIVVTQSVTTENKISQNLKQFCIDLARKHNVKRVYFFGALSLDNEEFLYGFVKFALYRNVIFAADASEFDLLSAEIKSFAEIAEIASPVSPFQNVAQDNSLELEMPFKIFVQDNLGDGTNSLQKNSEECVPQTKTPASETESERPLQKAEKRCSGRGLLRKAEAALQAL